MIYRQDTATPKTSAPSGAPGGVDCVLQTSLSAPAGSGESVWGVS